MRILLCVLLFAGSIRGPDLRAHHMECLAIRYPASASDLPNFYRAIQALSGNPLVNETAVVLV